ncbi:MAG: nascent polypeptide-associated complex protein [Candidatus Hadarchaeota archaeon]|nr:nascent polypeptide-associated complex protein [Candidatus Hadarchaeota archaeon]
MFGRRLDPRKMRRMMKQMGVKTKELEGVREVVIKLPDRELVIPDAQVTLTEMAGQRTYQVVGEVQERKPEPEVSEEDVKLVMEQAEVERDAAERVLKETGGDLAQAILKLKES